MNKRNCFNWFATILFGICCVLFVWTFALSVPIYCRFIYYSKINEISTESGYSAQTIKESYDDVLNYLTLHKEFGTGELACSDSAKEHFADCQKLFDLNLGLLVGSVVCIVILIVLAATKKITLKKLGKFNVWFYSAIVAILAPLLFGIVAAIDFDGAFVLFHHILFPGKTNWLFDPNVDQIINILPESYFLSCGIAVFATILAIVVGVAIWEIVCARKIKSDK